MIKKNKLFHPEKKKKKETQKFYHLFLELFYADVCIYLCMCVYLVTCDKVFPLALALLGASAVTLFLHPGRDHFPQKLITFGLHEGRVEFGPDNQEISGFLDAPLRKPAISATRIDITLYREMVMKLTLMLMMMMTRIHFIYYYLISFTDIWENCRERMRFGGKGRKLEKKGLVVVLYVKGWCEYMV